MAQSDQRAVDETTNADVLVGVLEVLADRLSVVPIRILARAGIDEELFELIAETLELVRRRGA